MGRDKRARVGVVVAAVVAAVLAGGLLYWKVVGPGRSSRGNWADAPAARRNPNATLYTAPSGILFDLDSAELHHNAFPALRAIVADVKASHLTGLIRVEGYTDDIGSDEYNKRLALARAGTVADWLVNQAGLDRSTDPGDRLRRERAGATQRLRRASAGQPPRGHRRGTLTSAVTRAGRPTGSRRAS